MRALFHLVLIALFTLSPLMAKAQDALSNAESALYAATQKRDIPGQLQAIQQIAAHYLEVERPKRALSYYRLGLETDPSEPGKAILLRQIAQVHLGMGELSNAQLFAQESLRILRAQAQTKTGANLAGELTNSLITLAHILLESLDFFQAQEDINESFRLSKSLNDDTLLNKSHQTLVRLREKQGNVAGTQIALQDWAATRKARNEKEQILAKAKNTTPLSLCEKNWKENNFAGALKAARSRGTGQTHGQLSQTSVALELCKAKSQLKLNRYTELLTDYGNLPKQHPLIHNPGMQLLVSRAWMGLEQYEKAATVSNDGLHMLQAQSAAQSDGSAQSADITELQFAFTENLLLIELQSPTAAANEQVLNLCKQAEQISSNRNSPVWGECALAHASAGKFDKALDYTQLADQWFAEFGTPRQKIENRLIKALIQVELGRVDDGLNSVSSAATMMEDSNTQEWAGFERKSNEIQALAAEKALEYDRASNFYKLALNAANTENNEAEMERLANRLATSNAMAAKKNLGSGDPQNGSIRSVLGGAVGNTVSRMRSWFEQLRTPEYLRGLNPFKKKSDSLESQ